MTGRPFGEFDVIAPGPPEPTASVEQFILLRELTDETADALLGGVGPDVDTELGLVDVRHSGASWLEPWLYDGRHANFLGYSDAPPETARTAYSDETYGRLREVNSAVDPRDMFRLNHNVPPRD